MSNEQLSDKESEILAMKYDTIRSELLEEKKLGHQRVTQSIAAIGVVGGYSLVSEQFVFITFIPLIIAFVFVLTIVQTNEVLLLAWEAYRIEAQIPVRGFDYEHEIGIIGNDNERDDLSYWYSIPPLLLLLTMVIGYVSFVVLAWFVLPRNGTILGQDVRTVAGVTYGTLSLFMVFGAVSILRLSYEIAAKVDDREDSGFLL